MHTENFYQQLGQKLKHLRKQSKLTQEQLGKHLGVTKSAIVNWETGIRKIPFDVLVQIAEYFNVTIDSLITKQITLSDILKDKIGDTPLTEQQERLLINYIELLLGSEE